MKLSIKIAFFIFFLSFTSALAITPPKPGGTCTKVGATKNYEGKLYKCILSGKKKVWDKGIPLSTKPVIITLNANFPGNIEKQIINLASLNLNFPVTSIFNRTGYTFSGWNTAPNGSGTDYSVGSTYTVNGPLTLYAKWTANTYSIMYYGNANSDGVAPVSQIKTHDVPMSLAMNSGALTRTGYTFSGWNTAPNGSGTDYSVGSTYTVNGPLTLYAKWTAVCSGTSSKLIGGKFRIKLFLIDPINHERVLPSGNAFVKNANENNWTFISGNMTGEIIFDSNPGLISLVTLPAMRTEYLSERLQYQISLDDSGQFQINSPFLSRGLCGVTVGISKSGAKYIEYLKNSGRQGNISALKLEVPKNTVTYELPSNNFTGKNIKFNMYPWEGKNTVLLTIRNDYNPETIGRLLSAFDSASVIYDDISGGFKKYTPVNSSWSRMINNKNVVAMIPTIDDLDSAKVISCGGNACAAPGTYGIEVRWQVLESAIWMLENFDLYDLTVFYELGRVYWPYQACLNKLPWKENDGVVTGYAVLMRYVTTESIGLQAGPEQELSPEFHKSTIMSFVESLRNETSLTLNNTLLSGTKVNGLDANAMWASLMYFIGENNGKLNFYKSFFSNCNRLPDASTTKQAISNWISQTNYAARVDLSSLFYTSWKYIP